MIAINPNTGVCILENTPSSRGGGFWPVARGVPRGNAQDARASPPPQPERLVMRKTGGGGGRSAKNVHPPRQNPRYAPFLVKKI